MHAHLVQLDIAWEDRAANRARVRELLSSVTVEPDDLIVLPEMFDTGFSFNTGVTADSDGSTRAFLGDLARGTRSYVVGGFTVLGADGCGRNRAVAVSPQGETLAEYDKTHLFPLGKPSEASCFVAGHQPAAFQWASAAVRVAPLICYDLRFPELFGAALGAGAEAFCVIANWPQNRVFHWRALAIARAIENQAFILAVNRTGRDPTLTYSGGSLVIDPTGTVLAEADAREQVISVDVSRGVLDSWRSAFPAWRERTRTTQLPGIACNDDEAFP